MPMAGSFRDRSSSTEDCVLGWAVETENPGAMGRWRRLTRGGNSNPGVDIRPVWGRDPVAWTEPN